MCHTQVAEFFTYVRRELAFVLSLDVAWVCCTEIFLECVFPRLGLLYRDLLRDRLGITVTLVFVFGKCVAPRDVREQDPA